MATGIAAQGLSICHALQSALAPTVNGNGNSAAAAGQPEADG